MKHSARASAILAANRFLVAGDKALFEVAIFVRARTCFHFLRFRAVSGNMFLFATIVAAVVVGEAWSPSLFLGLPGLAVWFTWVGLFPSLTFFTTFSELSLALFGVVSLTVSLIAIIAEVLFFGGFVCPEALRLCQSLYSFVVFDSLLLYRCCCSSSSPRSVAVVSTDDE